jgi:hypothetical protein
VENNMANVTAYVAYTRKAIIQVATLIITLGTAVATFSELPDKYASFITASVAAAGSVLHFLVPNADAPGTTPAVEPFDEDSEDGVDDEGFSSDELVTQVSPEEHSGQHRFEDPSTQ